MVYLSLQALTVMANKHSDYEEVSVIDPQPDNRFDSLQINVEKSIEFSAIRALLYCNLLAVLKVRNSRICLAGRLSQGVSDVTSLERVIELEVCTLLLMWSLPLPNASVSLFPSSTVEDCRLIY